MSSTQFSVKKIQESLSRVSPDISASIQRDSFFNNVVTKSINITPMRTDVPSTSSPLGLTDEELSRRSRFLRYFSRAPTESNEITVERVIRLSTITNDPRETIQSNDGFERMNITFNNGMFVVRMVRKAKLFNGLDSCIKFIVEVIETDKDDRFKINVTLKLIAETFQKWYMRPCDSVADKAFKSIASWLIKRGIQVKIEAELDGKAKMTIDVRDPDHPLVKNRHPSEGGKIPGDAGGFEVIHSQKFTELTKEAIAQEVDDGTTGAD